MLTGNELIKLKESIEQGDIAKKKLQEYNEVYESIECIDYCISKLKTKNISEINLKDKFGDGLEFSVECDDKCRSLINDIMILQKRKLTDELNNIEL